MRCIRAMASCRRMRALRRSSPSTRSPSSALRAPYRDHGRQDHRQEDGGRARHSGGPRLGGRDPDPRRGPEAGQRDRLSGHRQGDGGRWRARHEGRAQRRGNGHRDFDGAHRGQGRLRQRLRLHRKIPRKAAPHRNPGDGRRPGQCGPSGHARLLAAAPPPEGLGRGFGPDRSGRTAAPRSARSAPPRCES